MIINLYFSFIGQEMKRGLQFQIIHPSTQNIPRTFQHTTTVTSHISLIPSND